MPSGMSGTKDKIMSTAWMIGMISESCLIEIWIVPAVLFVEASGTVELVDGCVKSIEKTPYSARRVRSALVELLLSCKFDGPVANMNGASVREVLSEPPHPVRQFWNMALAVIVPFDMPLPGNKSIRTSDVV